MAVSFQPWLVGATFPSWDIPITTDANDEDLTGVNLALMTMTFHSSTGADTIGTGTFTLKSATSPAEVYYKPTPADVSLPFTGTLIIKSPRPPSNSVLDQAVYDPIPFVITAS